eukprot:7813830-Lingulodinium_polyedra.AAC.1
MVNALQQRAKTSRWEMSSALRRSSIRRAPGPKPRRRFARSTANGRMEQPPVRALAYSASTVYAQTIAIGPDCPPSGRPITAPRLAWRNRAANVTARRTTRGKPGR